MNTSAMRARCAAILSQTPFPVPFDLRLFADEIAYQRQRPIEFSPLPLSGSVTGAWVAEESVDVICYQSRTSPHHQRHIMLHELSHILCGHHGISLRELGNAFPSLLTGLSVGRLRSAYRATRSDAEEDEAELLASLIMERVNATQPTQPIADRQIRSTLRLLCDLDGIPDGA